MMPAQAHVLDQRDKSSKSELQAAMWEPSAVREYNVMLAPLN
jgi:hypothetical protein